MSVHSLAFAQVGQVKQLISGSLDGRTFTENFEVIATAAGGVASLRKLVLEVAIRGHLSNRRRSDGSTQEQLAAAHADRSERQERGEARQMEELSDVSDTDAPFELPATWSWTRIGLAVNLVNGRAFKPNDWSTTGLPIVRIQNLNNATAPFNYCAFEVEQKHILRPGDLLISWSGTPGTSFGAFIWSGPKGVLNQHIFRAEVYGGAYELGFLKIAINGRIDEMIAQAHGGVGLRHITKGKLEAMAIPLPPLGEQKRIVAKVDQLMALCDDLEARQTKQREIGARLTKSALEALTTAESPAEFDVAWKRVSENFDGLIGRAEDVAELRRCLVNMALRGRILRQNASEGTAEQLLHRLSAAVPTSTDKPLPSLPESWRWTTLGALVTAGPKNGYSPKGVEFETKVKSLTLTATTSGRFDARFFKFIDEEIPAESDLWLRDGDVLIQRGNTIEYVGVSAIYRGPSHAFIYPDLMMKVRISAEMDLDFVHMALNGPVARAFIMSRASGTSGSMPKINQATLVAIPIPVGPLNEQRRIMSKVSMLMDLCDDLEANLLRAEDRAAKLAEAAVTELVA